MNEIDAINQVSTIAQSVSVTVLFAWLYIQCRRERDEIRREYIQELRRQLDKYHTTLSSNTPPK